MNIRRFKKSGTAIALTLACLLGGFALGLAQEEVPAHSVFPSALSHCSPGLVTPAYVSQICFGFAAGDVPPSPHKSVLTRILYAPFMASEPSAVRQRPLAPKVARHMLDSILLI